MNKLILKIAMLVLLIASVLSQTVLAQDASSQSTAGADSASKSDPGPIDGETAIVMDAGTGNILYSKAIHQHMYPASITKIMTGILAVKYGDPSDVLTVSDTVVHSIGKGTASIALQEGEQITQDQALYGMFLASANDAALALAEHIGGTIPNFVVMMNHQAQQLGAQDTHFNNPDGLPDTQNYTSAYDMALISRAAYQMPNVMKYFGALTYTIVPTNKQPEARNLTTLHKMLKDTKYRYPGTIAGKTGWETMSGFTLVTLANRDGKTLICVVMKDQIESMVYKDTQKLLDYSFANYDQLMAQANLEAAAASPKPAAGSIIAGNTAEKAAARSPAAKTAAGKDGNLQGNVKFVFLIVSSALIFILFVVYLLNRFKVRTGRNREYS